MSAARRARVVLRVSKYNIPAFLVVLQAVYGAINGHPSLFPSLPIPLAAFLALIQTLETCQKAVKARTPGAAGPRNDARDAAFTAVETIRIYIQSLCDQNPEQAATLVSSAGMKIALDPTRQKPVLGLKLGTETGVVLLSANAGLLSKSTRTKVYEWQYTLDSKTWVSAQPTSKSRTSISGLPALTNVGFRVRVDDTVSIGEWTQVVSILVH